MQTISACNASFGENCQYQCSSRCINQICDRIDGNCLNGCNDGKQCEPGIFSILMDFLKIFLTNAHSFMKSEFFFMIYVTDITFYIDLVISFV